MIDHVFVLFAHENYHCGTVESALAVTLTLDDMHKMVKDFNMRNDIEFLVICHVPLNQIGVFEASAIETIDNPNYSLDSDLDD